MQASIGCDPEFFALDSAGKIIPAVKFMQRPIKVGNEGFIVPDGVVFEFNPFPGTPNQVAYRIFTLKHTLLNFLKENYDNPSLEFTPAKEMTLEEIEEAGRFDRSALVFGCNPDINIYGDISSYRGDASKIPWRFAGGHFHIDCDNQRLTITNLDRIVGLVINSKGKEELEKQRRMFYGRAGTFRAKHYGIEWRVPSASVFDDEAFLEKVMHFALSIVDKKIDKFPLEDSEVKEIINGGKIYEKAWEWLS